MLLVFFSYGQKDNIYSQPNWSITNSRGSYHPSPFYVSEWSQFDAQKLLIIFIMLMWPKLRRAFPTKALGIQGYNPIKTWHGSIVVVWRSWGQKNCMYSIRFNLHKNNESNMIFATQWRGGSGQSTLFLQFDICYWRKEEDCCRNVLLRLHLKKCKFALL